MISSEIRELNDPDLEGVVGAGLGFVRIPRPVLGPAFPSPSPTSGGVGGGTNGADGGGGGDGRFYNGGPFGGEDLHHID